MHSTYYQTQTVFKNPMSGANKQQGITPNLKMLSAPAKRGRRENEHLLAEYVVWGWMLGTIKGITTTFLCVDGSELASRSSGTHPETVPVLWKPSASPGRW